MCFQKLKIKLKKHVYFPILSTTNPPSETIIEPVMLAAESLAKKLARLAISSGSPILPKGDLAFTMFSKS